jgi:hypothetical protein
MLRPEVLPIVSNADGEFQVTLILDILECNVRTGLKPSIFLR